MPNRLAREQSLYLRQHAENPVDWYPWGAEALERARAEDRPILLSIGYSACHWCHVMERESFEDTVTARAMNDGFVCVKVDREERPDVDAIYMRAVQALTGHGGWPLTVFLTPDGRPFYGGTYFPPEPRHGMPSFRQLLAATHAAWKERRGEVEGAAARIGDLLRRSTLGPEGEIETPDGERVGAALVDGAAEGLLARFDAALGGFGRAPKFPQPVVLDFLLEHSVLAGQRRGLEAVLHTLRKMGRGGIRDHLAGGFHRYSVDARWLVPHFEKMLYDNALLAVTYLRGWQLSGDAELLDVCRSILDDLLGDFRAPEGAFYAARDADSEGEEGRFYVWTAAEVDDLLGSDAGRLFRRCYDVSKGGNFEGRNILHLPHDLDAVARDEGLDRGELDGRLAAAREILAKARSERIAPARDEKRLAGWNALAIRAFAEVGAALGDERYLSAAVGAAEWLLPALAPDGRLLHQVPEGADGRRIPAFLEDVAGLGNACLSLHEATLDPRWLDEAARLDAEVEARFRDPETGLLYDTAADAEALVVRPREVTDSPLPSGTSLAAELALRLGRLGSEDALARARDTVAREVSGMEGMPGGFGRLLAVAGRLVHSPVEVVILGQRGDPATSALLLEAHRTFVPGRAVTGALDGERPEVAGALLEGRKTIDGRPTAFVCSGFTCRAPVTEPSAVGAELESVVRSIRG